MWFSVFLAFATSSTSRCARPAVSPRHDALRLRLGSDTRPPGLADALRLRGGVQQLESVEDWSEIRDSEQRLVVLDFTAVWCGPCQRIAPAFAALAEEFGETALLLKVDVDELPELAAELGVTSMPTFLFFKGGEKVDTIRGADVEGLRALLEKHTA